jgi:hypothetical protein
MKLPLYITLLLLLAGCYTERMAKRRVARAQAEFPAVVAAGCAAWYPPLVTDSVRVELRTGETIYRYDTVTVDCDTVVKTGKSPSRPSHSSIVKIPCPPCPTRVDTLVVERTRQVENTARVAALESENAKLTKWRDILLTVNIGTLLLLLMFVLLYFLRKKTQI